MAYDFRSFLKLLDERGDLLRISKTVDRKFELPALVHELDLHRKAFIFENVAGAKMPLVGGLYTGIERFGLALDAPPDTPFTAEDHAALIGAAVANPISPQSVDSGPVKEVLETGQAIDLSALPIPTFFEGDSGAFITGAVGITRHPENGVLNVGVYRVQIHEKNKVVINAATMSDLRGIYASAEKQNQSMPIALAIGVEPALTMAGVSKPPARMSEYDVASALHGKPLELVRCETSDLLVPANAEIVIEGKVNFGEDKVLNTLAEFPGLYGPEIAPITEVTALTHRADAMLYSIMAGFSIEHSTVGGIALYRMGGVMERTVAKLSPNIKRVRLIRDPRLTGPMMHMVVSLDKQDDEEPRKLIEAAFAAQIGSQPLSRMIRRIVVVDDDIDVEDLRDIEWAIWTRVGQPSKFIMIPDVLSWELDRVADDELKSLRVGIDATMNLADTDKLRRPRIPGADRIHLEDYLQADAQLLGETGGHA